MPFRFYTQTLSRASRTMAVGIFMFGLMLIGFGALIAAFPKAFAYIVAALFILAGLGSAAAAFRIFMAYKSITKGPEAEDSMRSDNIRVRPPDGL